MKLETHQMRPLSRSLVNNIEFTLNKGFEAMKELDAKDNPGAKRLEHFYRGIFDTMIDRLRESVQIEDVEEEGEA